MKKLLGILKMSIAILGCVALSLLLLVIFAVSLYCIYHSAANATWDGTKRGLIALAAILGSALFFGWSAHTTGQWLEKRKGRGKA